MFWRTTPREAAIVFKGAGSRIQREHDLAASMAWHAAALSRVKKMPTLREFLPNRHKASAEAKPRDWKQQYAAFAAWAGSFKKD